jgi:hypothetical protein
MAMQVQPPLDFLPPRLLPWLPRLLRPVLPLLLRYLEGIDAVEADHLERLVDQVARFQRGEVRLLLAFRHPQTSDPLCLSALLWSLLPRAARAQGVRRRNLRLEATLGSNWKQLTRTRSPSSCQPK